MAYRSSCLFFGLLILFSLPFWLLGALIDATLLPGLPTSALMVVCPALAGGTLCLHSEGASGLWRFLRQAIDWKNLGGWAWAVAIGVMPAVAMLSAQIQTAAGVDLPAPQWTLSKVLALFALFLVAGIAEELGWTGYATRSLGAAYGVLGAGFIVGMAAVLWHLWPLLQVDRSSEWIAWWALATVGRRILIVWLYFRGGHSVFGASLLHAMSNLTWMLFPVMGSHYDPRSTALATLAVTLAALTSWPAGKPSGDGSRESR